MFSRDDRTDWGYDNMNGKGYKTVAEGGNYDNMTETMRNFYSKKLFLLWEEDICCIAFSFLDPPPD